MIKNVQNAVLARRSLTVEQVRQRHISMINEADMALRVTEAHFLKMEQLRREAEAEEQEAAEALQQAYASYVQFLEHHLACEPMTIKDAAYVIDDWANRDGRHMPITKIEIARLIRKNRRR